MGRGSSKHLVSSGSGVPRALAVAMREVGFAPDAVVVDSAEGWRYDSLGLNLLDPAVADESVTIAGRMLDDAENGEFSQAELEVLGGEDSVWQGTDDSSLSEAGHQTPDGSAAGTSDMPAEQLGLSDAKT